MGVNSVGIGGAWSRWRMGRIGSFAPVMNSMKGSPFMVALGLLVAWQAYANASETLIVQTLVLEAGGEGYEGMVAVGEVIRNRAKRGDLSPVEVVTRPKQFSCWNRARNAKEALARVSDQTLQRAYMAWEASSESNLTGGATHYANLGLCSPNWARKLERTAKVGQHTFFKERAR